MTSPYPRRADDFFLSRRADPGAARRVRRHGDPAPSEVPKFLLPHEAVGQVDTVMLAATWPPWPSCYSPRLVGGARRAVHSKTI
jgi:hypothetical protein